MSVTRLQVRLAYRDRTEAIGAAFLGGPVALPYGRFSDDERREVELEYLDSIKEFRDGDGYPFPASSSSQPQHGSSRISQTSPTPTHHAKPCSEPANIGCAAWAELSHPRWGHQGDYALRYRAVACGVDSAKLMTLT